MDFHLKQFSRSYLLTPTGRIGATSGTIRLRVMNVFDTPDVPDWDLPEPIELEHGSYLGQVLQFIRGWRLFPLGFPGLSTSMVAGAHSQEDWVWIRVGSQGELIEVGPPYSCPISCLDGYWTRAPAIPRRTLLAPRNSQ